LEKRKWAKKTSTTGPSGRWIKTCRDGFTAHNTSKDQIVGWAVPTEIRKCSKASRCINRERKADMTDIKPKASLDLRGVMCPTNFVKTKLKIESMEPGEVLEVILDSGEPIQNVPKSVKEEGHKIVKVSKNDGYFKLLIEV